MGYGKSMEILGIRVVWYKVWDYCLSTTVCGCGNTNAHDSDHIQSVVSTRIARGNVSWPFSGS